MEPDGPDVKRPRLEHYAHPQHPPHRLPPYSDPPHPQHQYPPHSLPPPPPIQPQVHSAPPPQQSIPSLPGTPTLTRTPRALPEPVGYPHARSANAPPVNYQSRAHSFETVSRPPSNPNPQPAVDQRPRQLVTESVEHGHHPSAYTTSEPSMNGSAYTPTGAHHPYSAGPVGPIQTYHPSPYAQPSAYAQAGDYVGQGRKRQVRATQACNNCRSRKQKCDEQRPCQFCRDSNAKCEYKEVPPPKQDRTLTDITAKLNSVLDELHHVKSIHARLDSIEQRLPGGVTGRGDQQLQTYHEYAATRSTQPNRQALEAGPYGVVRDTMSLEPVAVLPTSQPPNTQMYRHESNGLLPNTTDGINATPLEDVIEMEGEITLPSDHTTGAHQLMNHWPEMAPFFDGIVPKHANYPRDEEENRGILRIYGRGEGEDAYDGRQNLPSFRQDDATSPGPTSVPQDHGWGYGLPNAAAGLNHHPFDRNVGGLNPDGSLQLDYSTIKRLHTSYMENIHKMQPFLDKDTLAAMVDEFMRQYGYESNRHASFATVPFKRKHSSGPGGTSDPANPRTKPPQQVERSIGNAIILLVLALGKICEHKKRLPGPVGGPNTVIGSRLYPPADSPPTIKPSPASSHSALASIPSPSSSETGFSSGRRPSQDHFTNGFVDEQNLRNIDTTPGLAYYAYAVEIIGTVHGGNDLSHGQAGILASLYMGQLVRVLESWAWICFACRVACVLVDRDKQALKDESPTRNLMSLTSIPGVRMNDPRRLNLVKFLYWTCLQLESDILAEMSHLRPTGISKDEDNVGMPKQCPGKMQLDPPEEVSWLLYSSQIMLRKILNRAHLALYSTNNKSRQASFWARLRNDELETQLENWRTTLPEWLIWDDSNTPSVDRNVARLRGKYYGAKYIITRPILVAAAHSKNPPVHLIQEFIEGGEACEDPDEGDGQTWDIEKWRKVIAACKRCVDAAVASTTAFDEIESADRRLIVTNIFGTAHAQFGNILVLSAVRRSWLKDLIPHELLNRLMDRTINFLRRLVPMSPTLRVDVCILENTRKIINGEKVDTDSSSDASFSANT